jgi:hypothetical protein
MEIITLLLNPKILAVIGPVGAILLGVCITFYRLMMKFLKKYEEVQEKRIKEAQEMQRDFLEFSVDMTKTLDAVLNAIRPRNSNGGK